MIMFGVVVGPFAQESLDQYLRGVTFGGRETTCMYVMM